MNKRSYRLKFNRILEVIVAVAEYARVKSSALNKVVAKPLEVISSLANYLTSSLYLNKTLVCILLATLAPYSAITLAQTILPSGGSIKVGSGSIGVSGKTIKN